MNVLIIKKNIVRNSFLEEFPERFGTLPGIKKKKKNIRILSVNIVFLLYNIVRLFG